MTRTNYNKEYFIPVAFDEHGITKRLAYRMQIEGGVCTRFCVGYQVRDAQDRGRLRDIVRYDNAGGYFHRHSAGFPPGKDHITIDVLPGLEFDFIEADIATNANVYEAEAVKYGYEVPEDADDASGE